MAGHSSSLSQPSRGRCLSCSPAWPSVPGLSSLTSNCVLLCIRDKKVGIQPSTQLAVAHDVPRVCLLQPFTPLTLSHTAHSFACHVSLLAVTRHNSKEVFILSPQSIYSVPSLSIYKVHALVLSSLSSTVQNHLTRE